MPGIKKILFPVDFSESCLGAARYVEFLAGQFEAEIMLLHVVGMGEHNLAEELLPGRQVQLDALLADELKYFTTHRICVTGDAPEAITETAQSWNPDLVMMPTHGLGFFRRHLLGSTTAKVLHDLQCPVWTSVHAETPPRLEDIHCRRVLCAVDLTESSGSVVEWAAWLAGEYQAELGIVHATAAIEVAPSIAHLGEEFRRYVATRASKEVDALQARIGRQSAAFIRPGDPVRVISATVKEFDADLLVMGRHGDSGVVGALLQNAFAILRESPCPVVSV